MTSASERSVKCEEKIFLSKLQEFYAIVVLLICLSTENVPSAFGILRVVRICSSVIYGHVLAMCRMPRGLGCKLRCGVFYLTKTTPRRPTMPSSSSDETLRRAIALNNIAVNLLEKQAYKFAHDTFKEAALTIKQLVCPAVSSSQSSSAKQPLLRSSVFLAKASKRLSSPKILPCKQPITVLSSCESMGNVLSSFDPASHSTSLCAIRIEGVDFDVTLSSVMITYNLGVSKLVLSRLAKQMYESSLREDALRIFTQAKQVLAASQGDEDSVPSVLLLGIAILHASVVAHCAAGNFQQAREAIQRLAALRMAACIFEQDLKDTLGPLPSSAAAA